MPFGQGYEALDYSGAADIPEADGPETGRAAPTREPRLSAQLIAGGYPVLEAGAAWDFTGEERKPLLEHDILSRVGPPQPVNRLYREGRKAEEPT